MRQQPLASRRHLHASAFDLAQLMKQQMGWDEDQTAQKAQCECYQPGKPLW